MKTKSADKIKRPEIEALFIHSEYSLKNHSKDDSQLFKKECSAAMYVFDLADPYPMVDLDAYDYAAAKRHAQQVDRWLGLCDQEHKLDLDFPLASQNDQQLWKGLHIQSLMTPYLEIRMMLERLKIGEGGRRLTYLESIPLQKRRTESPRSFGRRL